MAKRRRVDALVVAAGALVLAGAAMAQEARYPDWSGHWVRVGGTQFDPAKPPGAGQEAPLTSEYKARFEDALAKRPADGSDMTPTGRCFPAGMPRVMIAVEPMEIVIKPRATFVVLSYQNEFRRIWTDGDPFPEDMEQAFEGLSVGHWEDKDANGVFQTLAVETRGLNGPRTFDDSGLPTSDDNDTVVKERIHLAANDPDTLVDEITTTDGALTRPWSVTRTYHRERQGEWIEHVCTSAKNTMMMNGELYAISDGFIKPTRPGQPPPDLKFFNPGAQSK
jgi:hypothetical protein